MSGVNDLVDGWRKYEADWMANEDCAEELEHLARTAWHPISEPPTEEDADAYGYVAVLLGGDEFDNFCWEDVVSHAPDNTLWARIRDVVLLPLEED